VVVIEGAADGPVTAAPAAIRISVSGADGQVFVSESDAAGVIVGNGTVTVNGQTLDKAEMEERRRRYQNRHLFNLLRDEDLRSEVDLSADQERRVAALIDKHDTTRQRVRDDVRMQFGRGDVPGVEPEAYEREIQRETWTALREAQPALDEIIEDAVGVLTEEQRTRLQEAAKERNRLRMACGDLWVLATRRAADELDLDARRHGRIRDVLGDAADRLDAQRKAIYEKVQDLPAEERGQAMRAAWEAYRKTREASIETTRDRVFALLTDEQRTRADKLIAEAAGRNRSNGNTAVLKVG
jgi:hypothetical protein